MPILSGKAVCSHLSNNHVHEFIHFAVLGKPDWDISGEDMTVVIALIAKRNTNLYIDFLPLPCVCELNLIQSRNESLYKILTIRINTGSVLVLAKYYTFLHRRTENVSIQIFVMKYTGDT